MSFELSIIIKTTVVLVCAGLCVAILRRASSATRHALWAIALLNALLLPVGSLLLPAVSLPVLPQSVTFKDSSAMPGSAANAVVIPAERSVPTAFHAPSFQGIQGIPGLRLESGASSRQFTLQQAITAVWILGFLIVFVRLVLATGSVRRLARKSRVLTDSAWNELREQLQTKLSISEPVQLRIAGQLPPMTWGAFRHVILLPESATSWTEDRRRVVLAHELAHVKRHDGILQILVQVVCSVYWFSPMVWFASNRLRIERERACDDHVLNLGARADVYADHLLQIARGIRRGPSFATVSMADPSQLETRLISILDSRTRRRRLSRLAVMSLLSVVGVLTASIAAIQVTALAAMVVPSFETPLTAPSWATIVVARPQQTPVPEPAMLEGTVVRLGTNEPVPRARVILNDTSGAVTPLTVATDDAGRFAIQNVPPGRYQILATREGYVRAAYGQRVVNGSGAPVALASKQMLKDIVLAMTPTNSITGRIRNRLGEPVANVAVSAQKYGYEGGRQVLTLVQTVRTNDLGDYRLYYLEPGQYVVSSLPPTGVRLLASESSPRGISFQTGSMVILPGSQSIGGPGASTLYRSGIYTTADGLATMGFVSPADTGQTYLPVFFPGVMDPSAATPIKLNPGATFGAVDLTVSEVRAVRIRGQVTNEATGQPLRGVSIVLMSQGIGTAGIPIDHYGTISDTGAFDFRGIAPGSYELVASTGALPRGLPFIKNDDEEEDAIGGAVIKRTSMRLAPANPNAAPRLAARLPLNVGNADLDNITLPLQPAYAVSGIISIDGISAAESAAMTAGLVIHLQSDPPDIVPENHPNQRVQTSATPVTVAADGTFSTNAFAGTYQIGIFNGAKLPKDAYVKSVRFEEKDALNPRLVIDGLPHSALEIVIATRPGTFDASVVDEKQAPAAAVTVVLVPDAARRQHYDLYRFAITDDSGHAQIDNLAPGDYTAFTSEDAQSGAWWDPEFIKKYEGLGKPVHINEGGKHTLELKSPNR